MTITRRDFLKITGLASTAALFGSPLLFTRCTGKKGRSGSSSGTSGICPLCSAGCGIVVSVKDGRISGIDGDPEHPLNRGMLCAAGSSMSGLYQPSFTARITRPLYRKPGADAWEEITWDEALKKIADRFIKTRELSLQKIKKDQAVPASMDIALLTGEGLNNEESYLISKFAALTGISRRDHEGRLDDFPSKTALMNSLGYGGMTNTWHDISRSNALLIIGSNPALNHPMAMRHIMAAKEKGCKIICADPRFTGTAAVSDYHIPIRPGTDTAFILGIINHALGSGRVNREYLANYTNAPYLVNSGFSLKDGLFSGYNREDREYDSTTWSYVIDAKGIPRKDRAMNGPDTVYQLLKKHAARYTPDRVSEITGCPRDLFISAAEVFTSTFSNENSGAVVCGRGIFQHSTGTQGTRALIILQLLLGNIGRPGGGISPLPSGGGGQGAFDQGLYSGILPGCLQAPDIYSDSNLTAYLKNRTPKSNDPMSINWLGADPGGKGAPNTRRYIVSLLKAWFGGNATAGNNFCYDWLPKRDDSFTYPAVFREAQMGSIKGLMLFHTDPLALLPNQGKALDSLKNLEWLVCADTSEPEISSFWKRDGIHPKDVKTEVFLLPMALPLEKDGSLTDAARTVQWSSGAVSPAGMAISALEYVDRLFMHIRKNPAMNTGEFPEPIARAEWNYRDASRGEGANPLAVAREINGYFTGSGKFLGGFNSLEPDGTTACGNWLYSGCMASGENMMTRRDSRQPGSSGIFPGWAWSWPQNRRILYNRAGTDVKGEPWDKKKYSVNWDGKNWTGDVPDGDGEPGVKNPFIMLDEGVARIFCSAMGDGPFPEYYEPMEGPLKNIMNSAGFNPIGVAAKEMKNSAGSTEKFPHAATTFSSGPGGKLLNSLQRAREMFPLIYCEISPGLAAMKGIESGDMVKIISRRGAISMRALVTARVFPWEYRDRKIELVAIVDFCNTGGPSGLAHIFTDPVSGAPESKAFLVNVEKVRERRV